MKEEYGGYIECEYYYGNEYHNKCYNLDSVRRSFAMIIRMREYRRVYLPYYLCSCIYELLDKIGVEFIFYNIDKQFMPIIQTDIKEDECLFLVNYYGQLNDNYIINMSKKYNIFLDDTQAFFHKPISNIDMANSCRKFFGVTDGSYLSTNLFIDIDQLKYESALDKIKCLVGRFEKSAAEFYQEFVKNEEIMRGLDVKRMSKLTQNILRGINYTDVICRRRMNYQYLETRLNNINELHLNSQNLFMYPLLIKNGDKIKRDLIENKIYVPTLWPGVIGLNGITEWEKHLIEDTVLLPIDQRYSEDDMAVIYAVLKRYL